MTTQPQIDSMHAGSPGGWTGLCLGDSRGARALNFNIKEAGRIT